jgi:hypothetical protein
MASSIRKPRNDSWYAKPARRAVRPTLVWWLATRFNDSSTQFELAFMKNHTAFRSINLDFRERSPRLGKEEALKEIAT